MHFVFDPKIAVFYPSQKCCVSCCCKCTLFYQCIRDSLLKTLTEVLRNVGLSLLTTSCANELNTSLVQFFTHLRLLFAGMLIRTAKQSTNIPELRGG